MRQARTLGMPQLDTLTNPIGACVLLALSSATAASNVHLTERMAWAADYLHIAIHPSGRFDYIRHVDGNTPIAIAGRYNLLRHAGSLYALANYHAEFPPNTSQVASLRRAARYIVDCCTGPVAHAPGAIALWSHPHVVGRPDKPVQAKLGGAGLLLAALLSVDDVVPGVSEPTLWRGLGEFLVYMQRDDGHFVSKYVPANGGLNERWTSLYYPGEAALGLILLFEKDHDPRWLRAAMDALRYLARSREHGIGIPPDHWALIATARLLQQPSEILSKAAPANLPWSNANDGKPDLRDLLIAHGEAVVESILVEHAAHKRLPCGAGGFDPDGRVTPTATRLEGLISAMSFLPDKKQHTAAHEAAVAGIALLAKSQLEEATTRGAVPRVTPSCWTENDRRAREIRIDYVQHTLGAFLQAHRSLRGP